MSAETIEACCKINLGLHVLRKRDDGYHEIETVLYPLPWCDTVSFEPADAHVFTCSNPLLPVDESNLCVKARIAFEQRFGQVAPVKIHLEKRVPYGSGLGGGSSDAAAVLRYLAGVAGIEPTDDRLLKLAGEVGSDVPFFLFGGPAIGTGRGERLDPIEVDFPYHVVVATPDIDISTRTAYDGVVPRNLWVGDSRSPRLMHVLKGTDRLQWQSRLINDFEAFILGAFVQIERIKSSLYASGAFYASLSGSGSAVFGLFDDADKAEATVTVLQQRQIGGWIGDRKSGRAFGRGPH